MQIEIDEVGELDTIPTAELIAGSHFSGLQLFEMFNIDKGRCILGRIKQLRREYTNRDEFGMLTCQEPTKVRAEAKRLIPLARKGWNHDMWYMNRRQRGGVVLEDESVQVGPTSEEVASKVDEYTAYYEQYTQEQLLSDGEGMDTPFEELPNQCPEGFLL